MCDLIDLNSPDTKGLLGARLASPLIPVPSDNTCDNRRATRQSCSLVGTGTKRDSLENNPFDMVLHKTTEYIQKKDDPFEVALERAMKLKQKEKPTRSCSVEFADDFTPKHKRHIQMMKLNRTLDESLIVKDLGDEMFGKAKLEDSLIADLNNTKLFDDHCKEGNGVREKVPTIDIQSADLSILNQSVLNDDLSDTGSVFESKRREFTLQGIPLDVYRNEVSLKSIPGNMMLKVPKARRCVSQGDRGSPKKIQYLNQTSQSVDDKTRSLSCGSNASSLPSSISMDFLNDGFCKSQYSEGSVFSSLSNLSAISKSTVGSCGTTSSMATSHATINRSFIESCSSDGMDYANSLEGLESRKRTTPVSMTSTDAGEASKCNSLMSDLVDRLSQLKTSFQLDPNVSKTLFEEDIEASSRCLQADGRLVVTLTTDDQAPDKLIDVDVFKPEKTSFKEDNANSVSSDISSPGSAFQERSRFNKSIFQEAENLARTFEELAMKSSSGSSCDDLMSNNPLWTLELLPAFEEEAMVENLIELPVSPNTNTKTDDQDSSDAKKQADPENPDAKSTEKDLVKDLEAELIEPEKKITAATLLLDLKKLIKTEHNAEVTELLGSLEKALGIECKNNTELLETYLCPTNNLAKSPHKSNANIETVRNVEHESMEQSQEENANVAQKSPECLTESPDVNLNVMDVSKQIDTSVKCITDIKEDSDIPCEGTPITPIASDAEEQCKTNSTDRSLGSLRYTTPEGNNESFNEKVAADLLTNLGKLLNGKSEEQSVLTLLKTLGKVISSTPNNQSPSNNETETDYTPIQQTPKKSTLKSGMKGHSPALGSMNRRSLNAEPKKKSSIANLIRRSISVTQSPPEKTAVLKNKNATQLKEVKKRFPSDPGLLDSISKKAVTSQDAAKPSTVRTTITITDTNKEKSMAIASVVKSKLKKKSKGEVVNKKGPLKAILPISNMQRKDSITKKPNLSTETITPPKPHKILSSTPNSVENYAVKKSPRNKPVASSTPDAQPSKVRKIQIQPLNTLKKRNFSCDISPVVTTMNAKNSSGLKDSPKKENTLPSPRKTTPKRRPAESSIPKSFTSPVIRRANSSMDMSQHERLLQSPQRGIPRKDPRKNSPVPPRTSSNRIQQSPLKDLNKLSPKVKPFNLISKLRRHSNAGNVVGKENNCI